MLLYRFCSPQQVGKPTSIAISPAIVTQMSKRGTAPTRLSTTKRREGGQLATDDLSPRHLATTAGCGSVGTPSSALCFLSLSRRPTHSRGYSPPTDGWHGPVQAHTPFGKAQQLMSKADRSRSTHTYNVYLLRPPFTPTRPIPHSCQRYRTLSRWFVRVFPSTRQQRCQC